MKRVVVGSGSHATGELTVDEATMSIVIGDQQLGSRKRLGHWLLCLFSQSGEIGQLTGPPNHTVLSNIMDSNMVQYFNDCMGRSLIQ
jgi:hypothetical protein